MSWREAGTHPGSVAVSAAVNTGAVQGLRWTCAWTVWEKKPRDTDRRCKSIRGRQTPGKELCKLQPSSCHGPVMVLSEILRENQHFLVLQTVHKSKLVTQNGERVETGHDFIVISCTFFKVIFLFSMTSESEHDSFNTVKVFFFSFSRTNVCYFTSAAPGRNRHPSVPRDSQIESQAFQDDRAPHRRGGEKRTGSGLTGITGDAREPFCALRYTPAFWGWEEDSIPKRAVMDLYQGLPNLEYSFQDKEYWESGIYI